MASDVLDPVTNPDLEDLEEGECSDDDGEEQVEEAEQTTDHQAKGGLKDNEMERLLCTDDVETEGAAPATQDNGSNHSPHNNSADQQQEFENDQLFQEDHGVHDNTSASTRERRDSDRRSEHSGGESSSRRDSERKHKKHKRHRSRSRDRDRDRDRDREKRHKKSKKRDREEYDPDDEQAKKKFMLKRLKALEGEMGLVPSEEEYDDSEGKGQNSQPQEKKAHTRFCNLYMQGKCPRDSKDCLFSHDIEVPKVWELCKFYVYDRCAKRDKCLYLHKEFPCKYFHLGLDCGQNETSCKFSHSPLTPKLKSLLIKHVETAPKELLGDFPRMNNKDAIAAIMMTEAAQNRLSGGGWLPKNKDGDNSPDWDSMADGGMADFEANPAMMINMMAGMAAGKGKADFATNRNMQQQMLQMMSMLRQKIEMQETAKQQPKPTPPNKPLDLMSIKVNEKTVKKTLQRIQAEKRSSSSPQIDDTDDMAAVGILRSDSYGGQHSEDGKNGGSGGDTTPDVTPPVSPSGEMVDDYGHTDDTKDYFSHRDDSYLSPGRRNSDEQMCIDEFGRDRGRHRPSSHTGSSPGQNQSPLGNQRRDSTEYSHRRDETVSVDSSNRQSIDAKSPPQRAQPSGKVDPRKAKRAAREQQEAREREENERLEKEKEQRMLDIDLGDVLGDLDLPPLSVSDFSPQPPISSMPAPLISPRLPPPAPDLLTSPRGSLGSTEALSQSEYSTAGAGLPFKPHFVHAVARVIEASLHSHDPIPWVLRPVDVQHRDYSAVALRHGLSSTMLELDPRLRRYSAANGAGYSAKATVMSVSPKSNAAAAASQSPLARQHSLTPQSPTVTSPPNNLPTIAQPKPVKVDPRLNRARKT